MKAKTAILAALITSPALADPGHFAESACHSHWLAAAALGLAALVGGVALWRGRRVRRLAAKVENRA